MTDIRDDTADEEVLGRARKDWLLIEALLQGANNVQAAAATGYSRSTVERRLADPAFRRRVVDARKALQERTLNALAGAGPIGVLGLIEAARGTDANGNAVPWTARIQACKVLADYGSGNVNRFGVDFAPAGEESEEEVELSARLAEYRQRAVEALSAAASEVVEADAVEVPPAAVQPAQPAPRARQTRRRA